MAALYVHHEYDHGKPSKGTLYLWLGPGDFRFTWIDPTDGKVLKTQTLHNDIQVLTLPVEVQVDLVARIDQLPAP
ncbi:MAG: hypothetical protein ACREJ2_06495 [Planctomycetota bacterium]